MADSGKRKYVFSAIIIMTILLAAVPAVSAYTVSQVTNPAVLLQSGEVITIKVSGLIVGDNFKYRLTSSDLDTIGDTVISSTVDLPIGFKSYPVTHLSSTGYILDASPLTVDYNHGGVLFNPTYPPNPPSIDITNANVYAGDYVLTLKGTKIPGAPTTIDYSVDGKIGTIPQPDPQLLTFTITNADSGHLTIEVFDGAVSKYSERYTIGKLPPTPSPDPNNGPGPVVPEVPNPQLVPPGLLAPPGYPSSTLSLQHNNEGNVLTDYNLDTTPEPGFKVTLKINKGTKVVTATGKPVNELILTPLDPAAIPVTNDGIYPSLGIAAECEPTGTRFSPGGGAILSFVILSPELWATTLAKLDVKSTAMTIGFYDTASGTWIDLPASVDLDSRTISAPVTHFSIFSVISKSKKEAPTTAGSLDSPTPAVSQMAPTEATPTPGLPGVAVIGTVLIVGYCVMKKKQ